MNRTYHVAKHGSDLAPGTEAQPFLTISRAAQIADRGDRVIVHEGVYREWVSPANGGLNDAARIVYEAAEGEHVVIKGSEAVTGWTQEEGDVWRITLPAGYFGAYNPYADPIFGDWLEEPKDGSVHTGQVYLNGFALYEAKSRGELSDPHRRETGMTPGWSSRVEYIREPEKTVYQWYAEVREDGSTVIWANFQGENPNEALTEINVRRCCFYPEKPGRNYITVRGFEMAHGASNWAPPTGEQMGILGAHWSRGWIIENNHIHDARCCGVSLGQDGFTGNSLSTRTLEKSGYQYQMEAVFRNLQLGWSKELIGSHIVRNNVIHDCGQCGIVGHMGCAFSTITGNHIYNVGVRHEFFGWEIAGIKLHAAIDLQLMHNYIHACTLGTWLDWQAQGARIHANLYADNDRDLMIEVTHGPHTIDHNIFASAYNFDNAAQGSAFVNNLCCGFMRRIKVLDRTTPYHYAHSTQVAGNAFVMAADDRLYNNIFVGTHEDLGSESAAGTEGYNGHPSSFADYKVLIDTSGMAEHVRFMHVPQPVYIDANAYYDDAKAYEQEEHRFETQAALGAKLSEENGGVYLELEIDAAMLSLPTRVHSTQTLGYPRIVGTPFDQPDGSALTLDRDYLGQVRADGSAAGPFSRLAPGKNRIRIW
ncbi:MAG: right-handed parallel beta-helix repeat-containing protein [Clostridia bacterium]|nr:right-handed parallel beta-helix repeat-containing protein [Clostridia bacterium]